MNQFLTNIAAMLSVPLVSLVVSERSNVMVMYFYYSSEEATLSAPHPMHLSSIDGF